MSDSHVFWETLGCLADTIFPPDATSPGATGFGVLDYIRGLLSGPEGEAGYRQPPFAAPADSGHGWQSPLTSAGVYEHGIAAVDQHCVQTRGAAFRDLSQAARTAVLTAVDDGQATADGRTFLTLVREHVIEGLFCDPAYGGNAGGAGWRWLGYPGPPALGADYRGTDNSGEPG
jgi:gluconate 2-dehydrogenase gamma chain